VRARLGVLPHSAGVYGALTVRENIEYFGRLGGLTRSQARGRARELIELLELADIADRRTKGFSQGQKIKTALARALVHAPKNLILDEPTNGLDVPSIRKLRTLLVKLRSVGHCILFSSHVMQEVATLCDDVVVIAHGRVVAQGTPEALRTQAGTEDLEEAFMRLTGPA
jgi:sodium transport system ATP-binding protein